MSEKTLSGSATMPAVAPAASAGASGDADSSPPITLEAACPPIARTRSHADRYETLRTLGIGGMGEVRLCKDRRIGREVAFKVMRGDAAGSGSDAAARFVREARVQGQLEHPAVVPVHDLDEAPDGSLFFTMKRVRGLTLAEVIAGLRSGDPAIAARYSRRKLLNAFATVCLALEFAHRRGVLHRDLKPGNVMLGDFGEVHVLDWGLARVRGAPLAGDEARAAAAAPLDLAEAASARTAHGAIMGTPGYMAPEQAKGGVPLNARCDLFSLGCVLYQMCTGELAFNGSDTLQIIAALVHEIPRPVREINPRVPEGLSRLVQRLLEKDPKDRPANAQAVAEELAQLQETLKSSPVPV